MSKEDAPKKDKKETKPCYKRILCMVMCMVRFVFWKSVRVGMMSGLIYYSGEKIFGPDSENALNK